MLNWIEPVALAYVVAHLSIHVLLAWFKWTFRLYHGGSSALAKAMVPFFLVADVLGNLYSITLLYREWPRWGEWTITARLKRWKTIPSSASGIEAKRRDDAWRYCAELSEYDPGHC